MSQPWDMNSLQFPRLLAELRAVGLTDDQYAFLAESMDCDREEVNALLERAEEDWQAIKYLGQAAQHPLGTPEISEERLPAAPVTAALNDDGTLPLGVYSAFLLDDRGGWEQPSFLVPSGMKPGEVESVLTSRAGGPIAVFGLALDPEADPANLRELDWGTGALEEAPCTD